MSDSVRPHRWQPTRLPHPWDFPGKSTGVGCHCLLCFFFWDPYNSNSVFDLSQGYLRQSSVLFILFTLFCSSEVISTILPSISLIHSSSSDILLLIPSRVFLISVTVLFLCLFFNSSKSLIYSCIFFHFVFNIFNHLYYHYSEFFFHVV